VCVFPPISVSFSSGVARRVRGGGAPGGTC